LFFIEPELRTEHFPLLADAYSVQPNGGAFSKLKGTLESYSTSSLVVPYTHVGEEKSIGSSIVMQLGRHLSKGASIIFASEDSESLQSLDKMSVSRISLEELKNLATKDWSIFSNGVTDIVIVSFDSPAVHADNVQEVAPSYAADDAYMHDLLQNIEGSYVAIYTADKPANEGVKLARATMMVRQLAASTGIYPAAIVEAQIVMIPFLFILFVGLCCTYSVQSDLKFDAEKKNLKK
jgi:phosphopentomutase